MTVSNMHPQHTRRLSMYRLRLRHLVADDSGVVAPIAVCLMAVLLGFCALALDGGMVLGQRRALQNAADAAALAGVREIQQAMLSGKATYPTAQAQLWAANNGVNGGSYSPTVSDPCNPNGTATINYNGPDSANQSCDPNASTLNQYCFVLKEGSSGADKGNFGILNFTCSGTSQQKSDNYIYWTEYGYGSRPGESIPALPWTVCTYTGNTASGNNTIDNWIAYNLANPGPYCPQARVDPNYTVVDFRCPLIGLLPILQEDSLGTGSSSTVTIIKFAIFEIVGLTSGATGHQSIIGQFLEWATFAGPTQYPDPNGLVNGLVTIRLVE